MDPRVKAIRESKSIGRGTCSIANECMNDSDIIAELDDIGITLPEEAVAHFILMEDFQMHRMMDQRWGEDSDIQVTIKNEWEKKKDY